MEEIVVEEVNETSLLAPVDPTYKATIEILLKQLKNILVKLDHFPKFRDEHLQNHWNHHLHNNHLETPIFKRLARTEGAIFHYCICMDSA